MTVPRRMAHLEGSERPMPDRPEATARSNPLLSKDSGSVMPTCPLCRHACARLPPAYKGGGNVRC